MAKGNQVLRSFREHLELSQVAFGKKAKLHPVYICQIETGVYRIGGVAVRRISAAFSREMRAFEITADDLLRGSLRSPA